MEIPLFPLPNVVLFPQVAVPLHIFEDRYKLMIGRCIDQVDVFGLVLLRDDAESENESTICPVGVTARVVQVERLEDGRLNILCAGESRFRVLEFTGNTPYWTAHVEFFEDDPPRNADEKDDLRLAYEVVAKRYRQAIELTSQLKETPIPYSDLPESPVALSYMVSYVLDLPAARKQELLETSSTVFRLNGLAEDLELIVSQLQSQIAGKGVGEKARKNGDLGMPH